MHVVYLSLFDVVTPRAGVWVEIFYHLLILKYHKVAPRAGVWVEIRLLPDSKMLTCGHSPCGSVG